SGGPPTRVGPSRVGAPARRPAAGLAPGCRSRRTGSRCRGRALRAGTVDSSREPILVGGGSGEGRLVELERVSLGIPQEAERAVGGPDDLLVADAGGIEAVDRQRQVVDDQLGNDPALAVVLR